MVSIILCKRRAIAHVCATITCFTCVHVNGHRCVRVCVCACLCIRVFVCVVHVCACVCLGFARNHATHVFCTFHQNVCHVHMSCVACVVCMACVVVCDCVYVCVYTSQCVVLPCVTLCHFAQNVHNLTPNTYIQIICHIIQLIIYKSTMNIHTIVSQWREGGHLVPP